MVPVPALTDLAKILAEARALHDVYRRAARRVVHGQVVHDTATERQALERAVQLRETAQALDDDFSDPAWVEDREYGFNHQEILRYYRQARERFLR